VCGKSACTVWRGEGSKPIDPSYPYFTAAPSGAEAQGKEIGVSRDGFQGQRAPGYSPDAYDNIAKSSLIPDTLLSRSSLCGRAAFTCTSVGAGEQHGSSQDPHATGGLL
jgi:hypothetical protein